MNAPTKEKTLSQRVTEAYTAYLAHKTQSTLDHYRKLANEWVESKKK